MPKNKENKKYVELIWHQKCKQMSFTISDKLQVDTEKFGKRWLGCDLSKFEIQDTRKRLLDIHNSKDLMAGDEK
jgi:hypothetical protein